MPIITIQGTPIEIPSSGESPNWAPGIIEAFQAIETALNSAIGPYDVASQILTIDAHNPGTDIEITNLSFPTSSIQGAFIRYSVIRTTTTDTAYETGDITITYNPNGAVNQKWEIAREYIGDGKISFTITDIGQVKFSTTAMGGLSHSGKLIFSAQAQAKV